MPALVLERFGRTPCDGDIPEVRIQVGEGGRSQIVGVFGKDILDELVPLNGWHAGVAKDLRRVTDSH